MHYLTAGESHGPQLTGIIEGLPAGLHLSFEELNVALAARQGGYGRGNRMKIEKDQVQIVGGVRHQITLGSPVALVVKNRDYSHWSEIMDPLAQANEKNTLRRVERPRPGHADLVGGMKYRHQDLRNVLERSSARETTMRVAIGNICKQLLAQLDIKIVGYVQSIGSFISPDLPQDVAEIEERIQQNDMRMLDNDQIEAVHALIDQTKREGDTLGGQVRVVVENVPAGLGSYVSYDRKLDGKIANAIMSMNAMKGVSIGDGFDVAHKPGSQVMDEITWDQGHGFSRTSNHLGGFEGGMTNGMPLIINAAMKPIPTLYKALQSVNLKTREIQKANVERSDTTAIVAASIVIESIVAIELAKEILETFESASFDRLKEELDRYRQEMQAY